MIRMFLTALLIAMLTPPVSLGAAARPVSAEPADPPRLVTQKSDRGTRTPKAEAIFAAIRAEGK